MQRIERSVQAPKDLGIEVIGVPEGAPVTLELRLESVMEGVLVTGTAGAKATGECVRCLEPLERELEVDFQEMYSYPEIDFKGRTLKGADAEEEDDEEESYHLEDDLFDLEPVLRDAVVLALPLQPVCQEDCPGLCSVCGARLADDPDHQHEAADPRWAALKDIDVNGAGDGAGENQEK